MNKKILFLVMLFTILATQTYANEYDIKRFPETIEDLKNSVGKNPEIIIPMQKDYYENEFQDNIIKTLKSKEAKVLVPEIVFKDDLALLRINTNFKDVQLEVKERKSGFFFYYNISNGYVLSINLVKYFDIRKDNTEEKKYLKEVFENYLLKNGFENKFEFNIISDKRKYVSKENIVSIYSENSYIYDIFNVEIKNIEIEENIDKINEEIKLKNFQNKYKELEKVLK